MNHKFPSNSLQDHNCIEIIYRCVFSNSCLHTYKKLSRHEATCRANCLYMEIRIPLYEHKIFFKEPMQTERKMLQVVMSVVTLDNDDKRIFKIKTVTHKELKAGSNYVLY